MAEVIFTKKQTRIRCSDEKFLEAVYSSRTFKEISEKTGQKIASTMARYARVKKALAERDIDLPEMERSPKQSTQNHTDNIVEIVNRLRKHHNNM